jgi:hypothetical protein
MGEVLRALPGAALVLAIIAATAIVAAGDRDSATRGERRVLAADPPARAADAPGRSIRDGNGPKRVIAPAGVRRGSLRFELARIPSARIVAAWLRRPHARHRLLVRTVARAGRSGVLNVRRPAHWRVRRTRLVVRLASRSGVYGCGFGRFRAGVWPGGCWRPYSVSSPFNRRLPAAPRVAADSGQVVARLLGFGSISHLEAGDADTEEDYAHPTFYARAGDPLFELHCFQEGWGRCAIEGHRIRVPDAARAAAGGDRHLTVVDQDSGWEYDLWQVRSKPAGGGLLEFRWGGRTRIDGDGLGSGATAAQFGSLAGIVRVEELAAGRIDHALFMTAHCDAGRAVYPARGVGRGCAELGLPVAGAPPMGAHFQLALSRAQIDALPVAAWKKTILRAMASYGMFLGDTGGGSWGIKRESGTTYTSFGYPNRLVEFARANDWQPFGDLWVGNLRDDIDWATHLRLLDPCVSQRTC